MGFSLPSGVAPCTLPAASQPPSPGQPHSGPISFSLGDSGVRAPVPCSPEPRRLGSDPNVESGAHAISSRDPGVGAPRLRLQTRSPSPPLLPGARFPNSSLLRPRRPRKPSLQPPAARHPDPLTGSGFGALPLHSGRCCYCLRNRWLGRGRREAAVSLPGSGGGAQQVQQLLREKGATSLPRPQPQHRASRLRPWKIQHVTPPNLPPAPPFLPWEGQVSWSHLNKCLPNAQTLGILKGRRECRSGPLPSNEPFRRALTGLGSWARVGGALS